VDSRLEAAGQSGADVRIDVRRGSLAGAARRASGGAGFDFVLVGPGKREVVSEAFAAVAAGGTLLLFTMAPPTEDWNVALHDLYFREVSVVPSYSCGPDDTREALRLLADRRVSAADLVTQRFSIAKAAEAFARAREPEGSMKVVFDFPG
jgi:L-iditol 2-dehydrogenase